MNIAKFYAILSKSLDGKLGGIGFNDFIVLYHLNLAPEHKLKRIELAEKVGLTASGVTRLLLPMEKIGLVNKESNPNDARVSLVILTPGGKMKLDEALERIEIFASDILPTSSNTQINEINKLISEIGGKIMWK
ncbi:MAG: MarR family winged helix-turn-helix transcriptional regulator [Candidatus Gracilibacteria bacterium]|nr:MarR family winged helix-turn-helix transcriptional regulator [Candidatus Gracilibacteria bacterium]